MSIREPTGPGHEAPPSDPGPPAGRPPSARRLPLLALAAVVLVAIAVVLFGALRDRPDTTAPDAGAGPVDTPGGTANSAAAQPGGAQSGGGQPSGTGGAPSAVATQAPAGGTAVGSPPPTAPGDHVAAGPVGGLTSASLDLVNGVAALTLQTSALGTDLYRVQTPANSALRPVVENRAGRITVRLGTTGQRGPGAVTILINPAVTWRIKLSGSAERESVNLTGARLAALDLAGGSSAIEVTLPQPSGTMVMTVTGGAGQLRVHAPRDVPARVRIGTGAGQVTVDGATRRSVQPGTTVASPGWDRAQNRFDVNATAGVASLTIDRV